MVAVSIYHVTAERAGKFWVLQAVEAPGAISQVSRLDQADVIREAIAFVTGETEASVEIAVEPALPEAAQRHLTEARRLRRLAEQANTESAREARAAARALHDANITMRDIGNVLGVSHQRAHQLISS